MRVRLAPCPFCQRHVRVSESKCPFCVSALPELVPPPAPSVAQTARLSRSARVALGAAFAAMTLPGCGGGTPDAKPPDPNAAPAPTVAEPPDDGSPAAEYGAPAPPDDGANAPEYGAPAP